MFNSHLLSVYHARYYHVHFMEMETEAQSVHYHALVSELVNLELRFKPGL